MKQQIASVARISEITCFNIVSNPPNLHDAHELTFSVRSHNPIPSRQH
jgi:hypothetical protein